MTKRARCSECGRPLKTCLCDEMVQLPCDYQLFILQDPKEAKHALSSAPILAKSIIGTQYLIGDVFDPVDVIGPDWKTNSLLIFPHENSLSKQEAVQQNFKHLILLDGTWRKVARMMHCNPWLSELACFAIDTKDRSQYLIRKSPREDGLSTIEAAVAALNCLHEEASFDPILGAFKKMIGLQIQAMGLETFEKNYFKK